MQDYHQLDTWQRSMDYAVSIYGFVKELPESERYNLVSQLQRAVTSVPLNIAEGSASATKAEFARFLGYAYRSLKEVITCLELCQRIHAAQPGVGLAHGLIEEGSQIARMTRSLIQRLEGAHDEDPINPKTHSSRLTTKNSRLKTQDS
jgi:four helix bundle protein